MLGKKVGKRDQGGKVRRARERKRVAREKKRESGVKKQQKMSLARVEGQVFVSDSI